VDDFGTNCRHISDFLLVAVRHGSDYAVVRAMNAISEKGCQAEAI